MTRGDRTTWLLFAACVALLFAGAAWTTHTMLRLRAENVASNRRAAEEESIRAAIRAMDSLVRPLLQQEADRPFLDYRPFLPIPQPPRADCPDPLVPSPLQQQTPAFVNVHFSCAENTEDIRSPQVPTNSPWITTATLDGSRLHLRAVQDTCACDELVLAIPNPHTLPTGASMRPHWVNGLLILARRVIVNGTPEIQGAWIDWPSLRQQLLDDVRDTLPDADLIPIPADSTPVPANRRLATLPVQLLPGPPALALHIVAPSLRGPLLLSWAGLLVAVAAVGILLAGLLRLHRRRGDFVSAVTHELRTPITGLQVNADLLAGQLVPDPDRQQAIAQTIQDEATRLGRVVENVLAYARIERGTGGRKLETLSLDELITRCLPRLRQRAEQAGRTLALSGHSPREITTDPTAVEQILFNLVDNACKYGQNPDQPDIHLHVADSHVEVSDQGPGIARHEARRIFEPFHKTPESEQQSPGVGLGLALARELARQLQAKLELLPATPGCTFRLGW